MPKKGKPDRIEPRKTPQQDRSIQRVRTILETASLLIAKNGVNGLTMSGLARQAEIPIGSVYQYFPEKAAIIRALFDDMANAVQDKMTEAFAGVTSAEQAAIQIGAMVDWHYSRYRSDPVYLSIWLGTEADRELLRLNMDHSMRVAEIFMASVRTFMPHKTCRDLEARCFLISHMIGAAMRTAVLSDDVFAQRLLSECKLLACGSLFS